MNFVYANPTQILFGQGRIASLANLIDRSVKVLLVYGGGSIKQNGIYQQITAALANHQWVEFAGVESNPSIETLDKAVALARQEQVGFILAVGGGSVIDGSKYIAAATQYAGEGWDIVIRKHRVKTALPIGVILTLPATGSESNNNSVITRKSTHEKYSFAAAALQPAFAVLDPDVMKTLPERQLANGVVDAFVHVCEQYITSLTDAWVQEGYAEVLLRNLVKLAAQFEQRDSDEWRSNLMFTANQALNGLVGSGVPQDWATHIIGHELTALYGIDHARTLSIMQPAVLRHQIENKRQKLEQMGRNVFGLAAGGDLAERTIAAIEALYNSLAMPTRIRAAGVDDADALDKIASALAGHGKNMLGERQNITPEISREIITLALA